MTVSLRQDPEAFRRVARRSPTTELGLATRALILDIMPNCYEVVWEKQGTIGYGTGPKKMTEHFCWIALAKEHVSLGFYYGSELADPTKLLEGSGKRMRHVKIRTARDLQNVGLRKLIVAATTHRVPPLK